MLTYALSLAMMAAYWHFCWRMRRPVEAFDGTRMSEAWRKAQR